MNQVNQVADTYLGKLENLSLIETKASAEYANRRRTCISIESCRSAVAVITVQKKSRFCAGVTYVKLTPRTFIAFTTMSNVSTPDVRTSGDNASTFDGISISP